MDGAQTRSTPFTNAFAFSGTWPGSTEAKALWVVNDGLSPVVLTVQPKYSEATLPLRIPAGFAGVVPIGTKSLTLDTAGTTALAAGTLQIIAGVN
jgi:hypothetical protein